MKNYYEILEVNETASEETINKVYKFLAKKYHPDVNPENKEFAEAKFKEISEAYEILSDSEKRTSYDAELKEFKESQSPTFNPEDFENLKAYCIELENQIEYLQNYTATLQQQNHSTPHSNYNNPQQSYSNNQQAYNTVNNTYNQNYNDAVNQAYNEAYNEAYLNTLRNLGYRIRYKKTFKDYFKGFISLILTAIILYGLAYICWQIPSVQNYLKSIFFFL